MVAMNCFAVFGAGLLLVIITPPMPTGAVFRPPPEPSQSSGVPWHSSLNNVVRCQPGEMHSRWPECRCGQYAKIVDPITMEGIDMDDPDNDKIFTKQKGSRTIYYTCLTCSGCPQGVIMIDFCRQASDTLCDPNLQCEDPDYVFDDGRKACIPDPNRDTTITEYDNEDETPIIPIEDPTEPTPTARGQTTPQQKHTGINPSQGGKLESSLDVDTILIIVGVGLAVSVGVQILVLVIYVFYSNWKRKRNSPCTIHRPSSVASELSYGSQTPPCSCLETAV